MMIIIIIIIIQSECEAAINLHLHCSKKMIVNPDKFQEILLDKGISDNTSIEVEIGSKKD